jgi:hypothetical protein
LNPTVLALAMLSPITESSLLAEERPLVPEVMEVRRLMAFLSIALRGLTG